MDMENEQRNEPLGRKSMSWTSKLRDLLVSNKPHQPQAPLVSQANVHQLVAINRLGG